MAATTMLPDGRMSLVADTTTAGRDLGFCPWGSSKTTRTTSP
jgi:hypothetical protein